MTPTGPRLRIDVNLHRTMNGRTPMSPAVAVIGFVLMMLVPLGAAALDLFTFWNDPEITLDVSAGDWVLYRMVTMDAGRRSEDIVRVRCEHADDHGWRLSVSPVIDLDGFLEDVAEGSWSFTLDRDGAGGARFIDHVHDVERVEEGERRSIADREWREDPLLSVTLGDGFNPDSRERSGDTTRVVAGRDLLCSGLNLSACDSTRIELPKGVLLQVHTRTVSVTLHDSVPFLGVVYASERGETISELDPPGRRRQPPPRLRIETMELIDFGISDTHSGGGG